MADPSVVYPSVFVVDGKTSATFPPDPRKKRTGTAQTLLFVLLILVLLGILIEGYFIFQLWTRNSEKDKISINENSPQKSIQDENEIKSIQAEWDQKKPKAHVTGCNCNASKEGKMFWESVNGDAFTHTIDYKDGSLVIKTEGFYFIYSKIFYGQLDCKTSAKGTFKHGVYKSTQRYPGDLELMSSKRYHCRNDKEDMLDNSFLGGIYHLTEGDQIFVKVNQKNLIRLQSTSENFFGAFLI
ncbi:tumor necrosis factor ligand superfamily member 14-like [Lepisosteus oculatus]|uniref:TNF superfamily member 14 n=1 Tax=Lepisosteus oculatus TaxID=7918 RepID=W5MR05_LEPOC|nr:PREDICTED: tumor necrosis factor ligand superfamily member 14-like [Lepisosteus oculatus]WFD54357.1 tumor necrosis factor superfamily member 14 [Lepisosteus oculatus]